MASEVSILGFAGSLRQESYNRALLRAAQEMAPPEASLKVFDLAGLPLFNQDLEGQPTDEVKAFKAAIRAADAVLIATPEYNYSVPGVLKNALDVASRPYGDNAFAGKPVGIMGASAGMLGSARAQYHLRQSCVFLDMHPLNSPEVIVPFAQDKIDDAGRVTDAKTRQKIKELLERHGRLDTTAARRALGRSAQASRSDNGERRTAAAACSARRARNCGGTRPHFAARPAAGRSQPFAFPQWSTFRRPNIRFGIVRTYTTQPQSLRIGMSLALRRTSQFGRDKESDYANRVINGCTIQSDRIPSPPGGRIRLFTLEGGGCGDGLRRVALDSRDGRDRGPADHRCNGADVRGTGSTRRSRSDCG